VLIILLITSACHCRVLDFPTNSRPAVKVSCSTPDLEAPEVHSIALAPWPQIVAETNPLSAVMNVTDDLSGVVNVLLYLSGPNRNISAQLMGTLADGAPTNGTWILTGTLSSRVQPGSWAVTSVIVQDRVQNQRSYNESQIIAIFGPLTLLISGTKGENNAVYISQLMIQNNDSPRAGPLIYTPNFLAHVTLTVQRPNSVACSKNFGPYPLYFCMDPASVEDLSERGDPAPRICHSAVNSQDCSFGSAGSVYRFQFVSYLQLTDSVPKIVNGTWRFTEIGLVDTAGHGVLYQPSKPAGSSSSIQVFPAYLNTEFEVTGGVLDTVPPNCTVFSTSPAAVDTSLSDQQVTVFYDCQDMGTNPVGLLGVSASLRNFNNTLMVNALEGSSIAGRTGVSITIPRFSSGVYSLETVTAYDQARNTVRFTHWATVSAGEPSPGCSVWLLLCLVCCLIASTV